MRISRINKIENSVAEIEYISCSLDNKIKLNHRSRDIQGMSHTIVTNKITGLFEGFKDYSKAFIFYNKITKHFLDKEGLIEMASILKPCAFCGSKGDIQKQIYSVYLIKYVVFCSECGTKGKWSIDPEEAINFWDKKYPTFSQFDGV